MGDVPGWLREQLQVEGWVVVESLETFDVHLGQRYANRATALQKALAGDALLSSRGKAATSRDLHGEFIIGRLRRSAQAIPSESDVVLLFSLDSIERHARPERKQGAPAEPARGERATRAWTCPSCQRTWRLLAEEGELPQERARCPVCGAPPSEFSPGQLVRVRNLYGAATRLGIIEGPVRADVLSDAGEVVTDQGPYTGELMVWHLREGYGSDAAVSPEHEQAVFSNLPREPERRRALAPHLMVGSAAAPEQLQALEPEEQRRLLA